MGPSIPRKKSKGLLAAVLVLIIALLGAGGFFGSKIYKQKQADRQEAERKERERKAEEAKAAFQTNLDDAVNAMIDGGKSAETCADLYRSVWISGITGVSNEMTAPYMNGAADANAALANLTASDTYGGDADAFKDSSDELTGYMDALAKPPKGYDDAYDAVSDAYGKYQALTELVENPGSDLNEFIQKFNQADADLLAALQNADSYADKKVFDKADFGKTLPEAGNLTDCRPLIGTWTAVKYSNSGVEISSDEIGASSLVLNADGTLTLDFAGDQANAHWEPIEGGLRITDSVDEFLCSCDGSVLVLDINGVQIHYQKSQQ